MALGDNAVTFEKFQKESILPKPVANEIMRESYGQSLVGRLAGGVPMPITGVSMAFRTGDPVAGVVGEGVLKPVMKVGVGTKTATPIKVATVAYWSKEARMSNPLAYLDMVEKEARDAIAKAIDLAVIHGIDGVTGSQIPGKEYITQSTNTVELGTSNAQSGGLSEDILTGYEAVINAGGEFTGFAADQRLTTKLLRARDVQGHPIYGADANGQTNLGAQFGTLHGLPVTFGRGVAGKIGTQKDTGIRLIGGAFQDNLKFGYVEDITYRYTDTGVINDGETQVNLFQQNMEAIILEAMFGWLIRDVNQFAVYKDPAGVQH